MFEKKKAAPKKKAPQKKPKKYCIWHVQADSNFAEKFDRAGSFDTKEKAEEYIAAHPGWPYLEVREA